MRLRNAGYDALDIEIPDVPIGKSGYTLEFPGRLALLGERSGIGFLEAWLKHETLPGLDGGQLHEVMRKAEVESIDLSVVYKDTDLCPKKTECAIDRTNRERHGLSVRATSAPGIPILSAPQPHTQTNAPEPLPRTVVAVQDFTHGQTVKIAVTNRGEGADFYAPLEIGEGIQGATKGLFAKWAHTDTIRTWIAKGETCHLELARLDTNQSFAQWKVLAVASDHHVRELDAHYSSSFIPLNKAPDVIISGSVISRPDAENGIQPFKMTLEAFRAV